MDINQEIDLLDCPLCQGASLLEEESGCFLYVTCVDCGAHTAAIEFGSEEEKAEAAKRAAMMWNMGKVLNPAPGE